MTTYRDSGVDIDAGQIAVSMMQKVIQNTYGPNVLSGADSFGGMIDVSYLKNMKSPVLVASTDGVGTKTKIAVALQKFDTIGQDLVNHCVNDILVQGANPLFFMDYIATSKLNPALSASVVSGIASVEFPSHGSSRRFLSAWICMRCMRYVSISVLSSILLIRSASQLPRFLYPQPIDPLHIRKYTSQD